MSIRSISRKVLPEELAAEVLELSPRGVRRSWAAVYAETGVLPSAWSDTSSEIDNPHTLVTLSPKHNNKFFNSYLDRYVLEPRKFAVGVSPYGVESNTTTVRNFETADTPSEVSWELLYRATRTWLWVRRVPGVRRVYVAGSAMLGVAGRESDVDLIIETYPHMVWVVRWWVKLLLKLRGQDVFAWRLQVYRWVDPAGHLERVARYKRRAGYKVDVGLITEDWVGFRERYVVEEPFMAGLRVATEIGSVDGVRGYAAQSTISKIFWRVGQVAMWGLSVVGYPLIAVWAGLYILKHRRAWQFVVAWREVCFYPLRVVWRDKGIS